MNSIFSDALTEFVTGLIELNIPFKFHPHGNGGQIVFPWTDGDFIICAGSIGCGRGMLESYGFPWDDGDVTSMTAFDALEKIYDHYLNTRG